MKALARQSRSSLVTFLALFFPPRPLTTVMSGVITLRFSELGLYGREDELSVLQECYRRVEGGGVDAAAGGGLSEIVLVSGGAGTGKSALVQKLSDIGHNKTTSGPLFVSGKFDDPRTTTGQPYAALCSALGELVELIMVTCSEADRKRMGEAINKAVRSEGLEVLEKMVPGIHKLVVCEEEEDASVTASDATSIVADASRLNSAEALNRLKFALRSFLQSVSSSSRPIVLFLDDLQWADKASINLIRSIITDRKLRLLFVGAYRDEEVDEESHPLAVMFRKVEGGKIKRSITRIQLKNLDVATVTMLISGLLRLEGPVVAELSKIVHQKTGGNAFFVLQFLSMLQDRELLYYSLPTCSWMWYTEKIRSETEYSENVVEFVACKIQRLPGRVATVLKLMACFPSTKVELDFLESILQGLDMEEFRIVR